MQNREQVIFQVTETEPGVVVIVWTDPGETPLQAIGRLNAEVIEAKQSAGLTPEMRDEIASAVQAVRDLQSAAEDVAGYAIDANDRALDLQREIDTVADGLQSVLDSLTEQNVVA